MTPLHQLRAAIIATNEDIMKLQFGCEIKIKNPNLDNPVHIYCGTDLYNEGNYISTDFRYRDCVSCSLNQIAENEILGRKIGLNDVLRAIEKADIFEAKKEDAIKLMVFGGEFYENREDFRGKFAWNKAQDDLNLATPETIDTLHTILCKK